MPGTKQTSTSTAETIDNSLFLYDVSDPWFRALGYDAMSGFIGNVRRDTILAYKISQFFQDEKQGVFSQPELFPVRVAKTATPPQIISQAEAMLLPTVGSDRKIAYQEALGTVQALLMREIQIEEQAAKIEVTGEDASKKKRKLKPLNRYSADADEKTKQRGANPADWSFLQTYLKDEADKLKAESSAAKRPAGYNNVVALCDYLGVGEDMKKVVMLLVLYHQVPKFKKFIDWIVYKQVEFGAQVYGRMAGIPVEQVRSYFEVNSPLVRTGLVTIKADELPQINPGIYKRLDRPGYDFTEITKDITGAPKASKLTQDNYPHIAQSVQHAINLLKGAIENKTLGVNILLHGPVGTGKTELAAAIADAAGCQLFSPGEKSSDGTKALSRSERMAAMLLAQALLRNNTKSLLLFDEMEDVLPADAAGDKEVGGKVFLNRLLEENPFPVIWAMNKPEVLDPSVLRRFSYSIRVPNPPASVRQTMYQTISRASNRALPDDMAEHLARRFKVAPALIEAALKFESLVSGSQGTVNIGLIEENLHAASQRLYGSKYALSVDEAEASAGRFNPDFINSDVDLGGIEDRVRKLKTPRFSACLYGPPGTGKSAWARYVATEILGLEVLFKRYSDLSSMWLGETEKKIREAFDEAQDGNMALIIDEADSFLRDRGKAERSWEVTEVNEMLTCLERAQTPVFMTTNLMKELDAAALRRFTFKANFQFMTPNQAMDCFTYFYGMPAPPHIRSLDVLTPGDFANVKKQQAILGELDAHALYEMLVLECQAKPNYNQGIGFGAKLREPPRIRPRTRDPE